MNENDSKKLAHQWLKGIKLRHKGHQQIAAKFRVRGQRLGFFVTICSVVTGTGVFGALLTSDYQLILVGAGLFSIVAVILSGLQTFYNYPELASKHYEFGMEFGVLRRDLERMISDKDISYEQALENIQPEWDKLETKAPMLPQEFYDKELNKEIGKIN